MEVIKSSDILALRARADSGVGKSCALERLVRDTTREIYVFRKEYVPTTGADLKRRLLDVHGVQIKLQTVRVKLLASPSLYRQCLGKF